MAIRFLFLISLVVCALAGRAETPDLYASLGWDLSMAQQRQASPKADFTKFDQMADNTAAKVAALARYFPADARIRQAALIRFRQANLHDVVYLIYRDEVRVVVLNVRVENMGGKSYVDRNGSSYRYLQPKTWDGMFAELRSARQQQADGRTEQGVSIPAGYLGSLHTYDQGKSHQILLTDEDLHDIHVPTVLGTLACATPLSGGHCRNYPRLISGWLDKVDYRLNNDPRTVEGTQELELCDAISKGDWVGAKLIMAQGVQAAAMQARGTTCPVYGPSRCPSCADAAEVLEWMQSNGFDLAKPDFLGRPASRVLR